MIEVFDNKKLNVTDSLIHKMSLSGWKIRDKHKNLSKNFQPLLFYDSDWKNHMIKFTIKDVFYGYSESLCVNLQNHTISYSEKENDIIITNINYFPFPILGNKNTTNKLIYRLNAIPLMVYQKSVNERFEGENVVFILIKRWYSIRYSFRNITFDKLKSVPKIYGKNWELVAYFGFRVNIRRKLL
ncbi:hypothetical protein RF11_02828 [Thelohanellus kitauei]|uniref:Uncharacterized protein n=1 Tax=Thelohanellus kitauei TaxID=669202 RepID=A0A0C2MGH0_THEKT|nr:hypothetical protein RF11_02828 [Thelohanellus kitauei]